MRNLRTARVTTGTGWPGAQTRLSLPDAWHKQTEREVEVAYAQGFADGEAYAHADIERGLTTMVGGPSAKNWKDAVDIHFRELGRKQAREAADAAVRAEVEAGQ